MNADEIGAAMRAKDRARKPQRPGPVGIDPRWYFTDVKGETRIACMTNGDEYLCPGCAKGIGWIPGATSPSTWFHIQALGPDQNPEKYCDRCQTPLLREGD